ncbi:hypothetical protein [Deinococcus aquaedulcis]|uniref:hypothetical protein n=1 Tax=Deinococcus aquaedulcis TaxID=2840455 RepID=UPI001C83FCC8|nr:hypothetical protein [Deinococcus aquaedulcis]
MRRLDELDFNGGRVTHIERDLDLTLSVGEQQDVLREDLLQVVYPDGCRMIDVGFYGHWPEGEFVVLGVRNGQWESPMFSERTQQLATVAELIQAAVVALTRMQSE